MNDFESQAVVDAINRMFASTHFSICTVDSCMKITGAVRTSDYNALALYHCVNYSTMSRDVKEFLFRATLENVCNVDEFPAVKLIRKSEEVEKLLSAVTRKPLLKRLFGL